MVIENDVKLMWLDIKGRIPETTRLDYDFVHWSLTPNGEEVDPYRRFPEDTTLYAVWKVHHYEYRITFEEEGGSVIPDIYVLDNVPFSEFMRLIWPPYRYGYDFVHWSLTPGGTAIPDNWLAMGSTKFYAVWSSNVVMSLSFDAMGGSTVRSMSVNPRSQVALPEPTKNGSTFSHWSTYPGGEPVDLKELADAGESKKRLYAVWKK